jgi:Domain of unknown function (DUF4129)
MRVRGSGGDGRRLAVAGMVGLAVVTLLLVVLAAGSGSVRPVSESTAPPRTGPFVPITPTETPNRPTGVQQGHGEGSSLPGWIGDSLELLALLVVAGLAFFLLRALIRAALRVLREIRLPAADTTDAQQWQTVSREDLDEAVTAGFARLDDGRPGDAIVACWLAFERAAADAGVARAPSETPAELTVRVLAAHWVSRQALERLADLYREARFSRHGLPESARAEARAALELLRRELTPARVPDDEPGPEAS